MTMRQTFLLGFTLSIGLLIGTLFGPLSWGQKEAEAPKPEPPIAGRYQSAVMGTSFIMTDTATGQSWYCDFQGQNPQWQAFTPPVKGKK